MNSIAFLALLVIALAGVVSAKNNFFVKTYFKPGSNCTTGASGKTQETFSMNKCLDTMTNYVDSSKSGFVDYHSFSDYTCSKATSTKSYELRVCQKYDSGNDIYPTAY